jgi:Uri superfamily endonuclease
VAGELALAFGGFRRGKILDVPAGDYVYVGSALSRTGPTSLGRRLARHATRTGTKPAHAIRAEIVARFRTPDLDCEDLLPRSPKRLHWNVDHLLDLESVELVGIIAIRSEIRIERELGQWLAHDPDTEILHKGLGANDVPGNTHLLRVNAGDSWWDALPERLASLMAALRHCTP